MLGKNSTALLMCAAATFVHAQASPEETLLPRALQEAADTEIEADLQGTAFDKDEADPQFDEEVQDDPLMDADDFDDDEYAEDLANNDDDDDLIESDGELSVPDQGEDDRTNETDNDYVAEAVDELASEDEMVEAADQEAREYNEMLPDDEDNDLAEGPPDSEIFDEDNGLDNDDDLLSEFEDDELNYFDEDEVEDDDLGLDEEEEVDPEDDEEEIVTENDKEEKVVSGEKQTMILKEKVHHAYGNVDSLQPKVHGSAGGEHAHHNDGKAHDDCDDCTAEAEEEQFVELGMFMLVAGSLTLLILWLMLRQCK